MKEPLEKIAENVERMAGLLEEVVTLLKAKPDQATPVKPNEVKLVPEAPQQPAAKPLVHAAMPEFDQAKALLSSDVWPEAVDPKFICGDHSDEDKFDRAEGVLDLFVDAHLEKLSVLDFGCGEGHLAVKALEQKPKKVVGYDVKPQWERHGLTDSLTFTDDWDSVKHLGPYNVVIIYDVLDHVGNDGGGVIDSLRKIRQVTAPGCKVFVQTHPWCGRTGGHLYNKINKAFVHLAFSEDELKLMGYDQPPFTRRVTHPLGIYQEWFQAAGFHVKHSHVSKEPVEAFFSDTPVIAKRIKSNWRDSRDQNLRNGSHFPVMQMEQHFINYTLC